MIIISVKFVCDRCGIAVECISPSTTYYGERELDPKSPDGWRFNVEEDTSYTVTLGHTENIRTKWELACTQCISEIENKEIERQTNATR